MSDGDLVEIRCFIASSILEVSCRFWIRKFCRNRSSIVEKHHNVVLPYWNLTRPARTRDLTCACRLMMHFKRLATRFRLVACRHSVLRAVWYLCTLTQKITLFSKQKMRFRELKSILKPEILREDVWENTRFHEAASWWCRECVVSRGDAFEETQDVRKVKQSINRCLSSSSFRLAYGSRFRLVSSVVPVSAICWLKCWLGLLLVCSLDCTSFDMLSAYKYCLLSSWVLNLDS